jgi:flagellin
VLDGSLGSVTLQVGSEANQTIEMKIGAMDSKSLGLGSTSIDLLGGESNISAATFGHNDVLINGQSIMASGETWDGASNDYDELINKINDNVNGVTASTVATAKATTAGDGVLSGSDVFTVTLTNLDGGTSSISVKDTENLGEMVDKLNAEGNGLISASISDDNKLILTAENVEKIDITDLGVAAGTIAASTEASIALTADSGDAITVTRGVNGTLTDLSNLGFRENDAAGEIEGAAVGAGVFESGDLKINGVDVGVSDSADLDDKLKAINSVSDESGVTAVAFTSAELDFTGVDLTSMAGGDFGLNGVDVTIGAAPTSMQDIADDINGATSSTGVTAVVSGTKLILEGDVAQMSFTDAANGDSIEAALGDGTNVSDVNGADVATTTAVTRGGGIKLVSDSGASIQVEHADAAARTASGLLDANNGGGGKFGASISSLDISTAAGAQKAIGIIDNALDTINSTRGDLGAIANRLDFTVSNLSNVAENVSEARSRIEDADFAQESANLSRAQVLQQAGTAMLAQANASPQQVLSLLQ